MIAPLLVPGRALRPGVQFGQDVRTHVQRLVSVDDDPARRVEDQVQVLLPRHLLDRRADLLHHVARRALVLLGRPPLRAPDVLDEALVVADGLLQRLLLLLPLQRRQDGGLVAHLGAQLVDELLLLGRLVAPALDLPVEAGLRLLGGLVLGEDASGVDVAEADLGAQRSRGQRQQRQRDGHRRAGGAQRKLGGSWRPSDPPQKFTLPSRKCPFPRGPSSRLKP